MSISRLAFEPMPGASGNKMMFKIRIDDREYVTGCFLGDDLVNLVKRFDEISVDGSRFDLFFSNASPFSVSVACRGKELYLRISDNFDGGVLEDRVAFTAFKFALIDLMEAVLGFPSVDPFLREALSAGLADFGTWRGPVIGP
jgi:hypothetical protein